jgi:ATP-dependent DNA helicase RecG
MRPAVLTPLFAPVSALPGVGPRTKPAFERLAGPLVVHLLWHLPSGLIDRRYAPKIAEAESGQTATLTVRVDRYQGAPNRRLPTKVYCSDETGSLTLVFFHARGDWLRQRLPEGTVRIVSGKVERYGEETQMVHPEHIVSLDERESVQTVEPIYPLSASITLKVMVKAVRAALKRAPTLPEWADANLIQAREWLPWDRALQKVHAPDALADLAPETPARLRLAYDELLANQLALALVRRSARRGRGRPITGDGRLRRAVTATLPFRMTAGQRGAIEEIQTDLAGELRMLRLLQGDVGSGKTVVALFAMLIAVEAGAQAALMAPTEILARQHAATLATLLSETGVHIQLLTGRDKGRAREAILAELANGEIDILVGTHALFQEGVAFKDLALAVVDEQHRFGVHQRMLLARKGQTVDLLVMTATPIPRSLVLTAYGDMDVSRLTERLPGRTPVETRVLPLERLPDIASGVGRAVKEGAKVYWVCPLVEESEIVDLAAVTDRHAQLKEVFGERVALVHGRMKGPEKDAAMAAFAGDGADILVATTVIEVGVDVPAATVMIIEHADRFGLAQLHQLRGRVGRSDKASSCLLLYASPLGETARARLAILRETDDGFRIAEEDLRLRGAGEVLGTRQSGAPAFHLADLAVHGDLLAIARDDVKLVLENDPELETERGQALRTLLYLFERDMAVRYLRSG